MDADRPSDWAGPVLELPTGPQRPNPARIYDYWLGGKDNFGVDREVAEQVERVAPWVVAGARANRSFVQDSVEGFARAGVDQFIDVGSGLPTDVNLHEIAQRVNPQARVVYVDHDPVVITHARAWLETDDRVLVLPGDARRPELIIAAVKESGRLDFGRPVAVLFAAVLHYFVGDDDPAGTVAAFREVMTPGSFVLITHVGVDGDDRAEATAAAVSLYAEAVAPCLARSTGEVAGLFEGFQVIPPGLQPLRYRGERTAVLAGRGRLDA